MKHELLDQRALAMERKVAEKLRADPALLARARVTLERWLRTVSPQARPALLEWRRILDGSLEEICAVLESTDERATRLRQSSPFCGILSREERTKIIQAHRTHEPHPA
jgi:hypothetical protein